MKPRRHKEVAEPHWWSETLSIVLPSVAFGLAMGLSWVMASYESLADFPHDTQSAVTVAAITVVGAFAAALVSHAVFRGLDSCSAVGVGSCGSATTTQPAHASSTRSHAASQLARRLQLWLFEDRPFLGPLLIIGIVYAIHLMVVSPGILSQEDTKDQLLMFFNLPNFRARQVVLLSPDVLLTNHHPVLHTLILGTSVQLGMVLLGSANKGLLLYTCAQVLLFVISLASLFPLMKRAGAPTWLRWLALLFFAFYPKLWNLSCLATKDVLFSAAVVAYLAACAESLLGVEGKHVGARLFCFGILSCLLRNNGVFLVALTIPFLFASRSCRKQGVATLASVAAYALVIMLLLPALHITGGSARETLSVPLQQTARVLACEPDAVTSAERAAISKVADPEAMAKAYQPDLADYVKNLYRADATREDAIDFLSAWVSIALRKPGTCVAASVDNHYGFYCFTSSAFEPKQSPDWSRTKMEVANKEIKAASEGRVVCKFHELAPRNIVDGGTRLYETLCAMPLASQSMQAAAFLWLLLFLLSYAISRRRSPATAVCLALLTLYAVSLLGPANAVGYTRYIAPAMIAWPVALLCAVIPYRSR